MNFGEKLKQLRTDKNLTQPQLADAIGIEQSYLSKLENDKSTPSAEIFQAILKALAIDVASLLENIDQKFIYAQLRQIPEVANYLNASIAYENHNIKKWLLGSAAACVIGLTLIICGGEFFNREVAGGFRQYSLRNTETHRRDENNFLMMLGTMLAIAGLFGFIIEFRLRKIPRTIQKND